jgi:hypothetical protein
MTGEKTGELNNACKDRQARKGKEMKWGRAERNKT